MPSSETESNGSKDLQNHNAKSQAKSRLSCLGTWFVELAEMV